MLRNPLKWRYLLHYWRGRVHSTQHKKQKFFCIQALFTLANLLMPKQLSKPVDAKTASCYDAQHPSPALSLHFQRG